MRAAARHSFASVKTQLGQPAELYVIPNKFCRLHSTHSKQGALRETTFLLRRETEWLLLRLVLAYHLVLSHQFPMVETQFFDVVPAAPS